MNEQEKRYIYDKSSRIMNFINGSGKCLIGLQNVTEENMLRQLFNDLQFTPICNYISVSKQDKRKYEINGMYSVILANYDMVTDWAVYSNHSISKHNFPDTLFIFRNIDLVTAEICRYISIITDLLCPRAKYLFIGNYKKELKDSIYPIANCRMQIV